MKKQTVGLCMIVKDEEENIDRAIASVADYVDVIYLTDTGSTDKTIEVATATAKRYKTPIEVSHFKWIDDFSAARNFNFSQAKTDWIFWIDADDTVESGQLLPEVVRMASERGKTGLSLKYRYWVDGKGNDMAAHNKMRLVRNGMYEWTAKAPIHENLFILSDFASQQSESYVDLPVIRHWADGEDFIKSGKRNLRILTSLLEREESQGQADPRTVFLLGREYHAQWKLEGKRDERILAVSFLQRYLGMSQWGGDRMQACGLLVEISASEGDYDNAEKYAYEAVKAHPAHPLGYVLVARIYGFRGEYAAAVDWAERARGYKISDADSTIHTPKGIAREIAFIEAEAYLKLGQHEKGIAILNDYLTMADEPEVADIRERLSYIRADDQAEKILRGMVVMGNVALANDQLETIKSLLAIVPEGLRHRKQHVALRRRVGLMKRWEKGNIVVFCGGGFEPWDESSLETGIGGSETAVVEMTRRWGKAGYKVTVFNSVEQSAVYGNVTYLPYTDIDFADHFDVFISWRNPMLASHFNVLADQKLLWQHDVPNPLDFDAEVIASYDKIVVLSKFHRTFLPAVPEEKFYYSGNGINVDMIMEAEKKHIVRNPHKIIYASSPDRGLENLLDILPDVRAAVPDVQVVWAYGWNTFDALRGHDPHAMEWKAKMQFKMEELGVVELGRLGKAELLEQYFSAGIWAYPTNFEEINCIVAQEAQACGCFPVTTGYAALEEVQLFGVATGYPFQAKAYASMLIDVLTDDRESADSVDVNVVRNAFDWNVAANNWMKDLFHGKKFEQVDPLVTVLCVTIRPGIFGVLRDTLARQTYKNFELVVVDGRYEERKDEVAKYMKDVPYPFLHLPDPQRDKKKYPYGLFHADNAGLYAARGEVIVFLQDFIIMPEDGIEKFVHLYKTEPDALWTGVDTRNAVSVDDVVAIPQPRSVDIFEGTPYVVGHEQFRSPRIRIGGARRVSANFFEWELNYAAAPRQYLLDTLGGFQTDWDRGFAYDNTEMALRHVYLGGKIIVDETNLCTALSHWDLFPADKEGVPDRDKLPNDERFANYRSYLSQRDDADVKEKNIKPKYPVNIMRELEAWRKKC